MLGQSPLLLRYDIIITLVRIADDDDNNENSDEDDEKTMMVMMCERCGIGEMTMASD